MQADRYSSLLPELFRHKSTKVRLFQPQIILLDFHGTMSERRWEDRVIYPYVKRSIVQFVRDNLAHETIQRCLPGLRNESFEQRFRNRYEDAPIIDEQTTIESTASDQAADGQAHLAEQVGEFLLWQMQTKRETRDTQLIERLVWQDGFRRKQIATPLYEEVMACVQEWREKLQINLHVISSIDPETLKLIFENTDRGNLHQYLSGYVCSKRSGDKLISETYKQFHDKTIKSPSGRSSSPSAGQRSARSPPQSAEPAGHASGAPAPKSRSPTRSPPRGPTSGSEISAGAKPILFLTDSGQEAKAASAACDGSAFDCVLVNRPGNKRIRTYYLSQFQYIERFDDIEFIQ